MVPVGPGGLAQVPGVVSDRTTAPQVGAPQVGAVRVNAVQVGAAGQDPLRADRHVGCHTDGVTPQQPPASLTGKLLVATPQVEGEHFRRSVVLLLHHDTGGAQGVVLNRPTDARVESVLPGWEAVSTAPQRLFRGGPVQPDSAIGIVTVPGAVPDTLGVQRLFGGFGVVDLDAPPLLVAPEVAGLRIFAGYAGWSGGQLEGEIRRGDWYVVDAESRDAFTDEPQTLWSRVLRRQSGNLAFVALFPDDPSLN